jgi:hypothetical protein
MVGTKTSGLGSLETSFCILRGSLTIRICGAAHHCKPLFKKNRDRHFGKLWERGVWWGEAPELLKDVSSAAGIVRT